MTSCTAFEETVKINHWDRPGLKGFIYENIFEPHFFNTLKNTVSSVLASNDRKTYLTHSTTFRVDDQKRKIISHAQNAREQCVIYDVTFNKDYYFQTNSTIKNWSDEFIKNKVSPVFYKCIKTVESLEPFASDPDSWVFYRLHLNYLAYEKWLQMHVDAAPHLTNVKKSHTTIDHRDARMYSITFYLYDHIEGTGGELYTPYGFIYKPKANSALAINGHQAIHGVNQNIATVPRQAFTMRIAHRDDLFLPGHPDKYLYNVKDNVW